MRLTERDLSVLMLTGLTRYVSTTQIAREFFPSEDTARRRIRKLSELDVIKVTVARTSRDPNLISLTAKGLRELERRHPKIATRIHLPGAIRLAGVPHHLMLVDTRLYLATWARQTGTPLLRWSSARGDLGAEWELESHRLAPDGLAELKLRKGVLQVAIEADTGSEGLTVWKSKLGRYSRAMDSGAIDELWVVVAAGTRRIQSLADELLAAKLLDRSRVMNHDILLERPLVEAPSLGSAHLGVQTLKRQVSPVANSALKQTVTEQEPSADRTGGKTGRVTGPADITQNKSNEKQEKTVVDSTLEAPASDRREPGHLEALTRAAETFATIAARGLEKALEEVAERARASDKDRPPNEPTSMTQEDSVLTAEEIGRAAALKARARLSGLKTRRQRTAKKTTAKGGQARKKT